MLLKCPRKQPAERTSSSFLSTFGWMKSFCALVGVVLLMTLASPLFAQQDLIVEIQVHGHRSVPADVVKAHIFTHPRDVYDQAAIERDFNSQCNTGFFEDIRVAREAPPKGSTLHVYVKQRPRVKT